MMITAHLDIILPLLAVGAFAGFIAGLLGIGGGMIIVPVVLWALQMQDMGNMAHAQHLAVGTSFAVMTLTTFSSMWAQHRKQSVDWRLVWRMAPPMVLGVLFGSASAKYLSTQALQGFFVVFTFLLAIKTITGAKPKPTRSLPNGVGLAATGGIFGIISSWVGIGGGSLSVPFMLYCNVPVRLAVGTSAALTWPVAIAGAIGYLVSGWSVSGLPSGTVGFWYLPAVFVLSVSSMLFAPIGVKAAHALPPEKLKLAFGLLLLTIAIRMLWRLL